ncbi:unnamed protein product [Phytophthora fragariaefolia]|uniref:Unnamed protein product n=1 Tax=Phytophthora fragariaefolia TaxID=1490495 RepID=A0A9W6YJL9_9STRA|nr:unnamed protein product [Phytophthora fragariaefolia]
MNALHARLRLSYAAVYFSIVAVVLVQATSDTISSSNDDDDVPSLSEMDTNDALAIAFMVVGLAVSSAGGIGGGLALGMIPVVIGGTILGALINKLIPSYIVSLLFVVVLAVSDARMTLRGVRLFKKEAAQKKAEKAVTEAKVDIPESPSVYVQASTPRQSGNYDLEEEEQHLSISKSTTSGVLGPTVIESNGFGGHAACARILERERNFAWGPHIAIMICYLGIVAASIGDASVHCGGVAYWVILLIEIPWVAVFVVFTSHYLHKIYLRKAAVHYQYVEGDIHWTKKTVVWPRLRLR